jgi:hypothetical protein
LIRCLPLCRIRAGLVLGCTHFPVLKQTIAKVAGPDVVLIDSAETTALAVENILREKSLLEENGAGSSLFLATDAPGRFAHLGEIFPGRADRSRQRDVGRSLEIKSSMSWPANAGHPDAAAASPSNNHGPTWMAHTPVGHDT